MYDIAKKYYEQYGDLDVVVTCRVLIENDKVIAIKEDDSRYKDAIKLGEWLKIQRQAKKGYGALSWDNDKEKKLNQIGMIWEKNEQHWNDMYDIAKMYYEQYGDLDVTRRTRKDYHIKKRRSKI